MEPIVTVLLSTIVFHEKMSILQIIGGLIVLSGALLVLIVREKIKPQNKAI
jgi:drug/metabolite transporter (DMT)-like permease